MKHDREFRTRHVEKLARKWADTESVLRARRRPAKESLGHCASILGPRRCSPL